LVFTSILFIKYVNIKLLRDHQYEIRSYIHQN
jgi:hypothetical protein